MKIVTFEKSVDIKSIEILEVHEHLYVRNEQTRMTLTVHEPIVLMQPLHTFMMISSVQR